MPILLDVNVLPAIFNSTAVDYEQFGPVRLAIKNRRVLIPVGGSKFRRELARMPNYASLYANFDRTGQLIKVDDRATDRLATDLVQRAASADFDDEHLIAILILSRCRVICTNDHRAMRFIRMRELYPKHHKRPSIYSGLRNEKLLRFV